MRGFHLIQNVLSVLVMLFIAVIWGISAAPGYLIVMWIRGRVVGEDLLMEAVGTGIGLGLGYLCWGICMVLLCGLLGGLLRPRLDEGRVPLESFTTIQWAWSMIFHRSALLFLWVMVPSFLGNTYYRLMGAKIGKGAQLNTDNINDAGMVTLGEEVVRGGHATINAHLTEKGELVLSPGKVGDGALLGTGSIVQPGCVIGEGAVIASRAVVPKWTNIPPGEVWGGVPAKCIRLADGNKPGD